MKHPRQAWALLLIAAVWWLGRRAGAAATRAAYETDPRLRSLSDELAYTDYLTAGDGRLPLDFADWVAAGKPRHFVPAP
jgi:hypothetical protein